MMKDATKLIFGIRTSGNASLSLSVDGQLPAQPPALLITTRGQSEVAIPHTGGTWTATLGDGDHVVRMLVPDDSWFKEPVTFALNRPATIVIPGGTDAPLKSWTAEAGTASDPKNPWPPPLVGKLDAGALTDATWLGDTLTLLGGQVVPNRSAPAHAPATRTGATRSG